MKNSKPESKWVLDVNVEDFEQRVINASQQQPVLVDLWAEWCAPCLVIAPVLQRVIEEHQGNLLLAKVEVDLGENMKLAGRYKVRGFPTVLLIHKGEEIGRFSGAKTFSAVQHFIDAHISI